MFGDLIGKVLGAPLRVVNIPLKILETVADEIDPDEDMPRPSKAVDVVVDAIEEGTKEALDD